MSKKIERKNRTNLVVKWPTTSFFTLDDIFALNRDAKQITLRTRLTKEIEAHRMVAIGHKTGGQGRPPKVFAVVPVPPTTLDLAVSKNITLVDQSCLQNVGQSAILFMPRKTVAV